LRREQELESHRKSANENGDQLRKKRKGTADELGQLGGKGKEPAVLDDIASLQLPPPRKESVATSSTMTARTSEVDKIPTPVQKTKTPESLRHTEILPSLPRSVTTATSAPNAGLAKGTTTPSSHGMHVEIDEDSATELFDSPKYSCSDVSIISSRKDSDERASTLTVTAGSPEVQYASDIPYEESVHNAPAAKFRGSSSFRGESDATGAVTSGK
jgi:hypothetical protein